MKNKHCSSLFCRKTKALQKKKVLWVYIYFLFVILKTMLWHICQQFTFSIENTDVFDCLSDKPCSVFFLNLYSSQQDFVLYWNA